MLDCVNAGAQGHGTARLAISGDVLEHPVTACRWGWVCACGCLPIKNSMAISSAAAHPHLSHALQGDHDSSIPVLLPLIFAFNSGFICGVLNFGEAISFSLQWNLARYFGWLGAGTTFAKGVLFTQARAFLQAHLFPKLVSSLLCSDRALCLFLLHNSRLEQLLCVSSTIPLYISGWREIIYMLCYSFVVMLIVNHVRQLLLPLLALLFGSSCMPAVR